MESIIEKYNNLQKQILSDFALKWKAEKCKTTFRDDVKKFYGFEKEFGWNILLNSFYVIDDTEYAKKSFVKFDLQGPSRHDDIGERYLRLYGVLNAFYQQKLAIDNLLEIHKIDNKREISSSLNDSSIIELRNKIGAHSTNFRSIKEDSEHKFDVFEISRPDLQFDKVKLSRNQNHFEDYNLFNDIKVFDKEVEQILSIIIGKTIKNLFKNKGKIFERYSLINKEKDGALVFRDIIINIIQE